MADALEVVSAGANAAQKKVKTSGKKPRAKPVHPRTSEMVGNAIKSLKERGGSSLQAIKKYIAVNYKVDSEKLSPFIKKYLKSAVASGELVQTKGKGASGSFKLAAAKNEKVAVSAIPARGRAGVSSRPKEKQPHAAKVKAKSPKKVSVKKTTEKKKQRASPAKMKKLPSKAKKAAKVPTKKPKAPRPKIAAKSKAPKKASPKKK
jgi:linker histone H1 and H5 family.